eukprot:4514-Pyramimonas_sp.AAC.1
MTAPQRNYQPPRSNPRRLRSGLRRPLRSPCAPRPRGPQALQRARAWGHQLGDSSNWAHSLTTAGARLQGPRRAGHRRP